ncbi:hypothetical protein F2Q69_00055097 [Brassica cretica]|uniref:Uncharacterized protein n=1 Tax=Brassica cretica TaxID=69181 RepID=A0A8S9MVQ0_BRACR|nr:hypothetical protein F2Q69_00055097 [Brassica cretica]
MHKPKPSEQPPEPVRTPSDDGDDPMEEDRVSTGRTLRRRNEKVAKHLKREANEKEKENFQKRVFRIPLHKPFEEVYSYMGASIEEHTRMHGFGLYPLVDVRDSSVATKRCVGKDRCKAVAAIVTIQRATFPRV